MPFLPMYSSILVMNFVNAGSYDVAWKNDFNTSMGLGLVFNCILTESMSLLVFNEFDHPIVLIMSLCKALVMRPSCNSLAESNSAF